MMQRAPTVKISNTWRLTLPRGMCKDMGIKPGDTLCMFTAGGLLQIVPEDKMEAVREQLRLAGISIDEEDES